MCSDNFWPFKCWFLWNVALWWHYQNVCRWLTIIPVQQHWLNKQSEQLGSRSKSPVHFDWFLTITYKPLKTDLLCATRLLIIFFCGSRLSALFHFIFNSRSPGGKITPEHQSDIWKLANVKTFLYLSIIFILCQRF